MCYGPRREGPGRRTGSQVEDGGVGAVTQGRGRFRRLCVVLALAVVLAPGAARSAAEVRLDQDFLAGLVEKLPPAPFGKAGQYRGSARGFRLTAIDPKARALVVACEVGGEFRPPIAGAVRRAVTRPGTRPGPNASGPEPGWRAFTFDVRASVHAEPGPDGTPLFRVDVDEVKRRELEGVAGALAKVLGRHFDGLVTQVADGKAALLSEKFNAQLRKKVAAFKEYGVLREVGYAPDRLVLTFDVTRFRADGVAGHVFDAPRPGTVPLYRWVRPGPNDHFYTTSPGTLPGHPYYVYERVSCHVLARPMPGTVPLHRWRGPREWFYTTAPDGEGVGRRGYRPETVACHVYPAPVPGTVPLYRFLDPRTGAHFYTTHPHAEFAK